jgi:UMP-CMP kinase
MIKEYITEGKIVPMEVTIKLLENAMRDTMAAPPAFAADSPLGAQWVNGKGRFLIDGFPRKMDQALKFDETVSVIGTVTMKHVPFHVQYGDAAVVIFIWRNGKRWVQ